MARYIHNGKKLFQTGEPYHEIIHRNGTENIIVYDDGRVSIRFMGTLRKYDSIEELIHILRAYERLIAKNSK